MQTNVIIYLYVQTVSKPVIPIKGRRELSCHHEIEIREDESAEQKAKP